MQIIDDLNSLRKLVDKKSKNISSSDVKDKIKQSYETWILMEAEIKKNNHDEYELISENFSKLYALYLKHHFPKSETLKLLRNISSEFDKVRLAIFSRGIQFKEDYKEKMYGYLVSPEYSEVLKYLKKAEFEMKRDPETSCGKSREAIEELFRVIRERAEGKTITRGTLGQHTSELEKRKLISPVENQFFKSGVYSFLSEKGIHANKERKDEIDALFGFKLVLITIEYMKNLALF